MREKYILSAKHKYKHRRIPLWSFISFIRGGTKKRRKKRTGKVMTKSSYRFFSFLRYISLSLLPKPPTSPAPNRCRKGNHSSPAPSPEKRLTNPKPSTTATHPYFIIVTHLLIRTLTQFPKNNDPSTTRLACHILIILSPKLPLLLLHLLVPPHAPFPLHVHLLVRGLPVLLPPALAVRGLVAVGDVAAFFGGPVVTAGDGGWESFVGGGTTHCFFLGVCGGGERGD